MPTTRRKFIKNIAAGSAALTIGGLTSNISAKNYEKIVGSNDRLNIAIVGLGRRIKGYYEPIKIKDSNVNLMYLCDVMDDQLEKAVEERSTSLVILKVDPIFESLHDDSRFKEILRKMGLEK